jgi:hypothetical protein
MPPSPFIRHFWRPVNASYANTLNLSRGGPRWKTGCPSLKTWKTTNADDQAKRASWSHSKHYRRCALLTLFSFDNLEFQKHLAGFEGLGAASPR